MLLVAGLFYLFANMIYSNFQKFKFELKNVTKRKHKSVVTIINCNAEIYKMKKEWASVTKTKI